MLWWYIIRCVTHIKGMNSKYFTKLSQLYRGCDDFRVRTITNGCDINVVSLDTMCSVSKIREFVIEPLICVKAHGLKEILNSISCGITVREAVSFEQALSDFTNGYTLVFVDGEDGCICVDTRVETGRSVTEPPTSLVMRGPREGFVEDVKVNITLLRKRLKTPDFKTVQLNVGRYTDTAVYVCYIEGIADIQVVEKIVQRISAIDIDGVMDSSYLSRYLDPRKTALFYRVGVTEKPDVAVAKMLEGRVSVVVDGSPMVLTLPYLFIEDLQSPGDYHESGLVTSVSRLLRFISVLASVLLPAVYVCLQKYNYQIIPLKFLITILNSTQSIPFSPLPEMLMVIIIFDILREANLRMPTAVGMSLSLVGAIVLGDAAVKAGLLSAPAVMVGALSGIGLYTMPENTLVLSMLRMAFTYIGGIMGLLGVLLGLLVLLLYMSSVDSFGTPYLAPYAPSVQKDRQDAVFAKSINDTLQRPDSVPNVNKTRKK